MHGSKPRRTLGSAGAMLLAGCALALAGCVVGNRYDYESAKSAVGYRGSGAVTVGTWDRREDIVSGDKDPDFVGWQRSLYGIPFKVKTQSGLPLATEMTYSIQQSLGDAGFRATPIGLMPNQSEAEALRALLKDQPRRALLLRLDEWQSDTNRNPTVFYDVTLSVYDPGGRRLAAKTLKGSDDLDGRLLNPQGKAKKTVPAEFKAKLEGLLNAPEIAAALK